MTEYELGISDWSSDVCSSDLACRNHAAQAVPDQNRAHQRHQDGRRNMHQQQARTQFAAPRLQEGRDGHAEQRGGYQALRRFDIEPAELGGPKEDRRSVMWGTRVSGMVDLGGRSEITKT